ncbi:hypothetical protein CRSA0334_17250 [Cronobacter malonaticus ENBT0334]|nr:hypothetical protein CRSA0334_17250 [Cronobacter malonaticus ENBT0334]
MAKQINGSNTICDAATSMGACWPEKRLKSIAMAISVSPLKQRNAPAPKASLAAIGASLRRLCEKASDPLREVRSRAVP